MHKFHPTAEIKPTKFIVTLILFLSFASLSVSAFCIIASLEGLNRCRHRRCKVASPSWSLSKHDHCLHLRSYSHVEPPWNYRNLCRTPSTLHFLLALLPPPSLRSPPLPPLESPFWFKVAMLVGGTIDGRCNAVVPQLSCFLHDYATRDWFSGLLFWPLD